MFILRLVFEDVKAFGQLNLCLMSLACLGNKYITTKIGSQLLKSANKGVCYLLDSHWVAISVILFDCIDLIVSKLHPRNEVNWL